MTILGLMTLFLMFVGFEISLFIGLIPLKGVDSYGAAIYVAIIIGILLLASIALLARHLITNKEEIKIDEKKFKEKRIAIILGMAALLFLLVALIGFFYIYYPSGNTLNPSSGAYENAPAPPQLSGGATAINPPFSKESEKTPEPAPPAPPKQEPSPVSTQKEGLKPGKTDIHKGQQSDDVASSTSEKIAPKVKATPKEVLAAEFLTKENDARSIELSKELALILGVSPICTANQNCSISIDLRNIFIHNTSYDSYGECLFILNGEVIFSGKAFPSNSRIPLSISKKGRRADSTNIIHEVILEAAQKLAADVKKRLGKY